MPIHDVGYRRWDGDVSNVWLRSRVVAGAGIRLVWSSHWLRRMLVLAWLPAAAIGVGFFLYEQELEFYHESQYIESQMAPKPFLGHAAAHGSGTGAETKQPAELWTAEKRGVSRL